MRKDLEGIGTREFLGEEDIFRMKPGEKFIVKAPKPGPSLRRDLNRFCHLRYMKDGAMVRIELVEPGIILISL